MNWVRNLWSVTLFLLVVGIVQRVGVVTAVFPTILPENAPYPDVVQPGSAAAPALTDPSFAEQVVALVNVERWNNGQLPPLKGNDLLQTAAQTHSDNMAIRDFFAHCDLDTNTSPWNRIVAAGYNNYSAAAENIAAGYTDPEAAMAGWMNSTYHRDNILSSNFREIGVGHIFQAGDQANVRRDDDGDCVADGTYDFPFYHYWTQNFGARSTVYPVVIAREAYETATREVQLYVYGQGWATEMRFRNAGGSWSAWQAYSATAVWMLDGGNGLKTVEAEIRNGSGTALTASDTIWLNELITEPVISLSPAAITLWADTAVPGPYVYTIQLHNGGTLPLDWTIVAQPAISWLEVMPASGSTTGGATSALTVTLDLQGMDEGVYTTSLVVSGNATNSPQTVPVTVTIADLEYIYLPLVVR